MDMTSAIVTSLFAIFGVVAGAALQFIFTRQATREQQRMNQTVGAYAKYLKAVAAAGAAHQYSDEEMDKKAQRDLLEGYQLITIYGSSAVIHALAEFGRGGGSVNSPKQKRLLVNAVEEMRKHTGASPVSKNDLSQLILHEDLSQLILHEDLSTPVEP